MECSQRVLTDKAEAFSHYMNARHAWAQEIKKVPKVHGAPVRPYPPPPDLDTLYGQWRITVCKESNTKI